MKPIAAFFAMAFIATIGLAPQGAGAKDIYRMSTLGFGTSAYVVFNSFANIVNSGVPEVEIQISSTGPATQHMVEAARGRIDFFTMSPTMWNAMSGQTAMFATLENAAELSNNVAVVFNFPVGVYHLVTYADSGISKLEDLEGKSVYLGPPGGAATKVMMDMVRGATGLVPDEDFSVAKLGWNAGHQAFQDRQLDAAMFLGNVPASAVNQLALTSRIRLLGIEQRHLDKNDPILVHTFERPGGFLVGIPPDAYGDNQVNTQPAQSPGVIVGLATRRDMDEETVYRMTKTWWENVESVHSVAPWMANISVEGALRELNAPLHPGAARYYREIGLEVPET